MFRELWTALLSVAVVAGLSLTDLLARLTLRSIGLRHYGVRVYLAFTLPSMTDTPETTDADAVEALLASLNQGDTPC